MTPFLGHRYTEVPKDLSVLFSGHTVMGRMSCLNLALGAGDVAHWQRTCLTVSEFEPLYHMNWAWWHLPVVPEL